jgi:hypothetical protein
MNAIEMFITAIIALALLGPLNEYVDAVNVSGTLATLVGLIPLLYVIILVAAFAYVLKRQANLGR